MLKSKISHRLSILFLATLSSVLPFSVVNASTFQETEVNQEEFIAIAQPFGENKYNLIVIEQIPEKNSCWSENQTSSNPVNVDLLLMEFDFSGHCRRSTDANGYSIRYDGQDYGLDYILTLVEKDGKLLLIGTNRTNLNQPPIIVGSSEGINGQPMKIKLNPGWRFTKRTYDGKVLGHVYFSYDSVSKASGMNSGQMLESIAEPMPESTSQPMPESTSQPMPENTSQPILESNSQPMPASSSEPMPESTSKLLERLKNTPEQMPESTSQPVPETSSEEQMQGNIREIVAPGIQPQKQIKKSTKIHPIGNHTKLQLFKNKFHWK